MEKTWQIREEEIRNEILEGLQAIEVKSYRDVQTVNKAIEVVKGAIGIAQ
jgi:hypothetical protein